VVDASGNVVSSTTTLNGSFGSCLVAKGTGILLNNEMDDFSVRPGTPNLYGLVGGVANQVEAGKRMLSSMTPTIVLRDGRPVLAVGSPGGSTIITTVFQVLVGVLDEGLSLDRAVGRSRFHHQWLPDTLFLERGGSYPSGWKESLQRRGHRVEIRSPIGNVQAVSIDIESGRRLGVSDPRGSGRSAGIDRGQVESKSGK
ncbi:MAG: gamma-glutamyltransferase, partial [Planctomycetota bacterium]|jgi:gamma-glutamyltranspeptidase/glutathione hydrolase|nr:gamma-glutamyltransferase [Planctomycetota bacterium]